MSMPSELVELQLIDSQGRATTFYTYDGYYSKEDRVRIRDYRREVKRKTYTGAFLVGLFTYYGSRKTNMADFSCRSYRVRKRGLLSGIAGFAGSLLVLDYLGTEQVETFQNGIAFNSAHLPLWKSKLAAVNPDRAYFQLLDDQDNEPSIFHSGLTPETAAELLPDRVIGSVPSKPQRPHPEDH